MTTAPMPSRREVSTRITEALIRRPKLNLENLPSYAAWIEIMTDIAMGQKRKQKAPEEKQVEPAAEKPRANPAYDLPRSFPDPTGRPATDAEVAHVLNGPLHG